MKKENGRLCCEPKTKGANIVGAWDFSEVRKMRSHFV